MKWSDAVFGGAILLLPVLAVVQWRWLGRLADAERDQMERQLATAAGNIARDISQEVGKAHGLLLGARPARPEGPPRSHAARYEAWAEQASDARLISGFYAADNDRGNWRLSRYDPSTREMKPAQWPAGQPGWPPQPGAGPILTDHALIFAIPRVRPGEEPDFDNWSLIAIDRQFITSEWFPQLLHSYLGADFSERFRIEVRTRRQPHTRIFGEPVDRPDVTVGLMPPPPRLAGGEPPGPEATDPQVLPDDAAPRFDEFKRGRKKGPPAPPLLRGGVWELRIQQRSGSPAQMMERARIGNFALSLGILAILAVSLWFLTTAAQRSERLAQLQLDFVAGVSHELRTPLAVIRSAGENLADGVTTNPDQVRKYGALVRDEGRRLSTLVEQVLSFARVQPGKPIAGLQTISLRPVFDKAVASAAGELKESSSSVDITVSGDPAVRGDETALVHCIRNLIANAARHGGGGVIQLSAAISANSVEITVDDKGPGLPTNDIPYIFDPFYRGNRAKQDQIRGLGLGLTLVKRIAEAHGGSVSAENRSVGGARFRVKLPAHRV